jgi:hypothetical protein
MSAAAVLAQRLTAYPEVLFALLFGSRARGTARPGSDLDVGVFLSPDLTRWRFRLRCLAALEDLGSIDLVVLNDAPALLAHRALLGELLFARDRVAYVRFFVSTIAAAEDERCFHQIHLEARQRRLGEGRFGRP